MSEPRGWSRLDLMKYGEMVGKMIGGFGSTIVGPEIFDKLPPLEAHIRIDVPNHGLLDVILRPGPTQP